ARSTSSRARSRARAARSRSRTGPRSDRRMSWPRRLALLVWELPQNLVGAALLAASRLCGDVHSLAIEHDRIFVRSRTLGISLGLFVFYSEGDNRYFPPDPLMKRHEHGHTFQSRL